MDKLSEQRKKTIRKFFKARNFPIPKKITTHDAQNSGFENLDEYSI